MNDILDQPSATLGWCLLGVICVFIGTDVGRDLRRLVSARNVFLLSIAAWFLVEAVILPEEVARYGVDAYQLAILAVLLSIGTFLIGYASTSPRYFDLIFRRLAKVDRPKLLWRVFLIAIAIGFLPLIAIAKGNVLTILDDAFIPRGRWGGPFQRGRYGGLRDAFLELQMFLRASIPLASAIIVQKRFNNNQRLIAAAFLTYMFARAFNSGTRSQVIEVFLPIAAAVYWTFSAETKRQAIRFGIPALTILAMVWSAATVQTRNSGEFDWEKATDAEYVGFEMFRELLFLHEMVPDYTDYKLGHTYLVQLANPIPRFLWPGKPTGDAGLEMAVMRDSVANGADLTISPGLIGEMHWNFGWIGVAVISGFLGSVAKAWDRIEPLAEQSIVAFTVFAAGLAIIFLSGRSINMSTLYGLLALVAVLILFTRE